MRLHTDQKQPLTSIIKNILLRLITVVSICDTADIIMLPVSDSHCDCEDPWRLDPDSGYCTIEECDTDMAFCMNGGVCNAASDGCVCPDGVSGEHCEDGKHT